MLTAAIFYLVIPAKAGIRKRILPAQRAAILWAAIPAGKNVLDSGLRRNDGGGF
ncbi:hypothetical protein AGMMS50256_17090 [Betaproteobacteria bacterium]|nr:hypothetical protein AGMMS50256_17090 [Betaproteobacteria bacterium]